MALTTIAYLILFCGCILGSVFCHPMVGLLGYLFTYHINPLEQWWGANLPAMVERYALILGFATLLGVIFQHKKLKYKSLLEGQEILLLAYVVIVAASLVLGLENPEPEQNLVKMAKVAIMLILAGHMVTTLKRYEILLFLLMLSGLYLGIKTYNAPSSFFSYGRLISGIGGSDFSDGNVLSGHFVMVLPLLSAMLIKGKWLMKGFCALSAVFMVNGIILIKSRSSFLALAVCMPFALLLANKGIRKKTLPYLILGMIGGAVLLDPGYLLRMRTIDTNTEEMDRSASSRIDFWKTAIRMARDHPLGIGAGNYIHYVGNYDSRLAGRDTHNTYLRCLAELGFQGLLVLLLLMANAFRMLSQISSKVAHLKHRQIYIWHIYGLRLALIGYFVVAFFISSTYVEDLFWLLVLPLFLRRCLENEDVEAPEESEMIRERLYAVS